MITAGEVQCEQMLANSGRQCQNSVFASIDGNHFCRLHYSMQVAKNPEGVKEVMNQNDKADFDSLTEFLVDAAKQKPAPKS